MKQSESTDPDRPVTEEVIAPPSEAVLAAGRACFYLGAALSHLTAGRLQIASQLLSESKLIFDYAVRRGLQKTTVQP